MKSTSFTEHRDAVNDVLFTTDGNYLVSAGQDGAIILRDIAFASLEQVACRIANRSFSPEEWNAYFQKIPFHQTCTGANSS